MADGDLTTDEVTLINKLRAYQRAVTARERALDAADKGIVGQKVGDKRYVLDFTFSAEDFTATSAAEAQTLEFIVDRAAAFFICRRINYSLAVIGSGGAGKSIFFTVSSAFRPWQMCGTVNVRDTFRDRNWFNVPLPDAFFGNAALLPRGLPRAARLPGGTGVALTYAPTTSQVASREGSDAPPSPLGIDSIVSYRASFSFIGVEVMR